MKSRESSEERAGGKRRCNLARALVVVTFVVGTLPGSMAGAGVFLTEGDAPRAVFPEADRVDRQEIQVTDELRERIRTELDGTTPSIWESKYVTFTAWHSEILLGRAFLVEEIGKHRPITFVVGIRPDGRVQDVAVVAYREAYGDEIRHKRFLMQYRGKNTTDSLQPRQVIANIAGATLSVNAASRAVKKALALAQATSDEPPDAHARAGLPR